MGKGEQVGGGCRGRSLASATSGKVPQLCCSVLGSGPLWVGLGPFTTLPALAALPSLDAIAHASCLADSPLSQGLKGQHLKASAGAREGE